MNNFLLFYKQKLFPGQDWGELGDIFVSAFNSSDRVREISSQVRAPKRYWLMLPEYNYSPTEFPSDGEIFLPSPEDENESDYIYRFLTLLGSDLYEKKLVIDITGIIPHYILALIALLYKLKVKNFIAIYGEPHRYLRSERTQFTDEAVLDVRQVIGYEGVHNPDSTNDLLVIGIGYDRRLIAEVAGQKEHAAKKLIFGLPSLRPDMYQESLLQAAKVREAVGPDASDPKHFQFAPAFDPFVTAAIISDIVNDHRLRYPNSNIYLSPLATKAQVLGFAFYYCHESTNTPTSIIFPFCRTYMRETSEGLAGAWLYEVIFPISTPSLDGDSYVHDPAEAVQG